MVGHRKGGVGPGRYPVKASRIMIKLLERCKENARHQYEDIDPEEMTRLKPDVGIIADSVDGVSALINKINKVGFKAGNIDRITAAKIKIMPAFLLMGASSSSVNS